MVPQIKVRAGMDPLQFLEPKGELKFYIRGGIGIMGQLLVIVETVVSFAHPQGQMPVHPSFLPSLIPLLLASRGNEELHFHLFELPHAEDELPCDDLIAEGLPGLGDPKGDLHPSTLLDVQKVDKNTLGGLRPKV